VRHKEDLVHGTPYHLQSEDMLFPIGSLVVDKVVQVSTLYISGHDNLLLTRTMIDHDCFNLSNK
jgi:hypothetical protein